MDVLGLSLASYEWERRLSMGMLVSRSIKPNRGIAAGSVTAVTELALFLNSAIKYLHQALPTALHYVHVDDISTTFLCNSYEELEQQAGTAGELYTREFQDEVGLLFALEKTFVLALWWYGSSHSSKSR